MRQRRTVGNESPGHAGVFVFRAAPIHSPEFILG